MTWVPWEQAWQQALYGEHGFYRAAAGPAAHFATSAQGLGGAGAVYAAALVTLMERQGLTTLVDLGCGRGELLAAVHRLEPRLRCVGVEVVPRPDLPAPVQWWRSPGGPALPDELADLREVLVVANEWLDVVPCPVAEVDEQAVLREVLVEPGTGRERLGDPAGDALSPEDLDWCRRHWPLVDPRPGDRVEVGASRDRAWQEVLRRVTCGVAVAVDYGHLAGGRPVAGTLTGYRQGRQVHPVPDGSADLTAHVAMDSLPHQDLLTQRDALHGLGVDGAPPPRGLAEGDPAAYLQSLSVSSAAAALTAPGGLGGFWWAVHSTAATGIAPGAPDDQRPALTGWQTATYEHRPLPRHRPT